MFAHLCPDGALLKAGVPASCPLVQRGRGVHAHDLGRRICAVSKGTLKTFSVSVGSATYVPKGQLYILLTQIPIKVN